VESIPFRRIVSEKPKLSANHTAEKHAFPQDNPQKVKNFRELSCGKFQYIAESQNLPFKAFTSSTDNFRQEINHG
jgi:hypothetical protein